MQALSNFARNMAYVMEKRDITLRQLGDECGVSYPYIQRILAGPDTKGKKKPPTPSIDVCEAIAKGLKVDISIAFLPHRRFRHEVADALATKAKAAV